MLCVMQRLMCACDSLLVTIMGIYMEIVGFMIESFQFQFD
jgi:hypothetical protein